MSNPAPLHLRSNLRVGIKSVDFVFVDSFIFHLFLHSLTLTYIRNLFLSSMLGTVLGARDIEMNNTSSSGNLHCERKHRPCRQITSMQYKYKNRKYPLPFKKGGIALLGWNKEGCMDKMLHPRFLAQQVL